MLNDNYKDLTLDEAAEKAGGYVAHFPDNVMEADYHAMSDYCKGKGIKPIDLTEKEYRMFLFLEYGDRIAYNI